MDYLWYFFTELVFIDDGEYHEYHQPEGEYCILKLGELEVEYFKCYVLAYDQITVWQDDKQILNLYRTSTGVCTELPCAEDL
jgi:hypothetical protein